MREDFFKSGNEWVRIDLHLHTKSDDKFKYNGKDFVKDYIQALKTAGIRIGAITNHNIFNLDEYMQLKQEAEKNDIWLLPGVELEINEGKRGMHILVVFDNNNLKKGNDFINQFTVRQLDLQTRKPNKKLEDILNDLNELKRDYILIFAHVDGMKGFLKELKPANYANWIRKGYFRDKILALQDINESSKKNFENEVKKIHGDNWKKYKPAYVSFIDPKSIEDITNKGKETYIKIGAFNFSALKFAFLNYELRIRDTGPDFEYPRIVALEIRNGRFIEDKVFNFNPCLNTIIGVRGSGKSSVIEVLRWIGGKKPLEGSDEKYKKDLVQYALGNGGEVALKVMTRDGFIYTIKKGYVDFYPTVLDENGKRLNIKDIKGLFDFIYFGQKDLSEITKKTTQQLTLIDSFIEDKLTKLKSDEKELKNKIKEISKEINKLEAEKVKIEDIKNELSTLTEKIRIYKEKGVDKLLKEQINFEKEKEKFNLILSAIEEEKKKIIDLKYSIEQSFNMLLEYEFEFYGEGFKNKLKKLKIDLLDELTRIEELFNCFDISIEEERKKAKNKEEELKDNLSKLKKEIDDSLDTNFYINTSRKIQQLEMKIKKIKRRKDLLENKQSQLEEKFEKLNKVQRKIYLERKKFTKGIEEKINFLKVDVRFRGDKETFFTRLENLLKGSGIRKNKIEKLLETFSDGYSLYKAVKDKENKLVDILGESDFYKLMEKIINNSDLFIIETAPDKIIIEYKLNDTEYKPLEKLSIGQRAAAILAMILLHQNKPVIIDQPEDDIDNSTIYEGIIKTILERKNKNQFIFVTHNSNIVVLGDSDNVFVSKNESEKLMLNNGSIDSEEVQREIIGIMEGGKEAFEKRKIIYKLWR